MTQQQQLADIRSLIQEAIDIANGNRPFDSEVCIDQMIECLEDALHAIKIAIANTDGPK